MTESILLASAKDPTPFCDTIDLWLLPDLVTLSSDRVVNVRIGVAESIAKWTQADVTLKDNPRVVDIVSRLKVDKSRDVK